MYNLYLKSEPYLKESTFRWRVYRLKEENCIYSVRRGVYKTGTKSSFSPNISEILKTTYETVQNEFPYTKLCIWETMWLHEFMVHQPSDSNIIIEVEKPAAESVFLFLQESFDNVFYKPDESVMDYYVTSQTRNIIVKNLLTTSPVTFIDNIMIPKIEKILVDIFIEHIYKIYQGNELRNIYNEIFSRYTVNCSNLYWFATKRYSRQKLMKFINTCGIQTCTGVKNDI